MPTGSPAWLRCAVERKEANRVRMGILDRKVHRLFRTGKVKQVQKRKGGLVDSYQYECSCGHVGWTTHRSITKPAYAPRGDDANPQE